MNAPSRVIFNTSIQYLRTLISVFVSLYTTRLILDALGVENFGLYSIVGGIVTMLSFIQISLSGTTQRYLSYYQGKQEIQLQRKIFNNSVITQLMISILLIITLLGIKPFLFGGFLNISDERLNAAVWVYYCMLGTLFFSMQSTPYFATLISHENILFASVVQLIDIFLKIPIALSLTWFHFDRLKQYALLLLGVHMLNFIFYYLYSKRKYEETKGVKLFSFDKRIFAEMFYFMGWTIYSTGCIVGRTQGIAVLINKFFGAAINASYGIALAISGQFSFISASMRNAIDPQIIKAEGIGDRKKMLRLSEISSKFSFLLLALISIPAIIEMKPLLSVWLKETPEHAVMFCQFVLLANLIDQTTIGLGTANKAIGNIRDYSLVINTIKIATIPAAFVCLYFDLPLISLLICLILFEFICAFARLPFLKVTGGLSIAGYSRRVFLCIIIPTLLTIAVCLGFSYYFDHKWSFLGTFLLSLLVMTTTTYFLGLCKDEKSIINEFFKKLIQYYRKSLIIKGSFRRGY